MKSFFSLLKKLFLKPLKYLALFFYKGFIINFYKLYLFFEKIKRIILPSKKIKPIYLFINKYVTHIVVVILVVSISFANIFAPETRAEGFGEKSILFALATGGNLEDDYIEETLELTQPKITSYLETQTTAVSAPQQILTTEDSLEEESDLTITGDTSALVKPELASIEASKKVREP